MVFLQEEKIHAKVMEVVLLYVMVKYMVLLAGVMDVLAEIDRAFIQKFVNSTIGFAE